MPQVSTVRGRLNYQTYGSRDKPALIFSNSLGTGLSMWQPQIDALQHEFFLIAYDSRGHGLSESPNCEHAAAGLPAYSIDLLGADVLSVLDDADIDRAHFCGISMGGLTGLWLGIYAPERLNKLVVCNTAAKIGQTDAWLQRAETVRREGLSEIARTAPQRWFTENFTARHPETVAGLTAKLAGDIDPQGYAACCEALAHADLRDSIARIPVPTLSVGGRYDPVTTPQDTETLQNAIPGAELVLLDASHISNIEAAAAFNQAVGGFLART